MTIVVAQALDTEDRGAVSLGVLLARSFATDLVLCGVLPHRWNGPAPARADVAHSAALRAGAGAFLESLHALVPDDVTVSDQVRVARSIPTALHEEVIARDADMLVLGSSEDGVRGHISVGSVADRLLHSAPVPVAIAPRGYTVPDGARMTRVTAAVDSGPSSAQVLAASAAMAHRGRVPLRMVTFAIRRKTMFPPEMGFGIEDSVLDVWREQAVEGQRAAIAALELNRAELNGAELNGDFQLVSESAVVTGRSWDHAIADMEWATGELLMMGSSSESVLARVFLGSTAARLLRAATVPTVVHPPSRVTRGN